MFSSTAKNERNSDGVLVSKLRMSASVSISAPPEIVHVPSVVVAYFIKGHIVDLSSVRPNE